jgi:peptidoglycan/LPS O-acetylase OafA/YrhL
MPWTRPGVCMRLPPSLRLGLYVTGAVVTASGLAWLVFQDGRASLMQIHGAASMALLVLIGAVAALHAPAGWRERKNRWSGATVAAALTFLALTGLILYYVGDDQTRALASVAHWTVGVVAAAVLGVHVWLGARHAGS